MTQRKLLVLSSTYPRWFGDSGPSFVHELSRRLASTMDVTVLCPSARGASAFEKMDNVKVDRYRYAPNAFETLVQDGGIMGNIRSQPLKILLLPTFLLSQLFTAFWLCFRSRPDVIHAQWLIPQGLVVALISICFRKKVPLVITSHGTDLWAFKGRVFKALKRWGRAQSLSGGRC